MSYIEELIRSAEEEWKFFGSQEKNSDGLKVKNGHTENESKIYWERVGVYWSVVNKNLDGRSKEPWSAAFISYIQKNAGASLGWNKHFPYAAAHCVYITRSINDLKKNNESEIYFGYSIDKARPEPGDLIGCGRASDSSISYNNLPEWYKSHCDVVVALGPDWIEVIGGNVGNSVTKRLIRTVNGFLHRTTDDPWFVVMKNRLGSEEVNVAEVDVSPDIKMSLA